MTPNLLLEHAGWVRRLAYQLVQDDHAADDLTQDAFVRALEHPPRADRPLRGWLGTVVRNLASDGSRRRARRKERESVAARVEADPNTSVVARAAAQREISELVLELPEPLRATLLLRHFDELSVQEIAETQGAPVATVKARLAEGRRRLRERLDRARGGDARAWLIGLLPAADRAALTPAPVMPAGPSSPLPTIQLGALLVNAKILLAVIVALIGTFAFVNLRGGEQRQPTDARGIADLAPPVDDADLAPAAMQDTSTVPEERVVAAMDVEDGAPRPELRDDEVPAVEAWIIGRVLDTNSRPVAGVRLRRAQSEQGGDDASAATRAEGDSTVTAGDGTFRLAASGTGSVVVEDERYLTVLAATGVAGPEVAVIVAPRVRLFGRVVDALGGGQAVPSAHLRVALPPDFRANFAIDLDRSANLAWNTTSDGEGAYAFDVPAVPGATLVGQAEGFEPTSEPLPPAGEHLVLLHRAGRSDDLVRGRVVDRHGAAMADAHVSLGMDSTRTDPRGEFVFDLADADSPGRAFLARAAAFGIELEMEEALIALAPGAQPATYSPPRDAGGAARWPAYVTLQLGGETHALEGTVVLPDGEPVADARVWLADPTFFGAVEDDAGGLDFVHVETLASAGPSSSWTPAVTDADGRFRIEGLFDRSYRVEAMHPETLLRAVVEDVAVGRGDLTIVMPTEAVYPTLLGTVMGHDGAPIPGVSVYPMCDSFRLTVGEQTMSTYHSTADGTTTDADGRFELVQVPRDLVYLRLQGEDVLPLEWGRHVEGGLVTMVGEEPGEHGELVITVDRRCRFQVELGDPGDADAFAMRTADDVELQVSEFLGSARNEAMRQPILDGRSNPMAASDAAATIVLYRDGHEVRRAPVRLVPGELVTVRL